MGIGGGLRPGVPTDLIAGIRPGDDAYEDHQGAVFHPQDESGNGNMAFYEIQNPGDVIDLDLTEYVFEFDTPIVEFYLAWGDTKFDLVERDTGNALISDMSGYSDSNWIINISSTNGNLRLTNFTQGSNITGDEAGWLAFIALYNLQQA